MPNAVPRSRTGWSRPRRLRQAAAVASSAAFNAPWTAQYGAWTADATWNRRGVCEHRTGRRGARRERRRRIEHVQLVGLGDGEDPLGGRGEHGAAQPTRREERTQLACVWTIGALLEVKGTRAHRMAR
jgi:hypothetical protein